MLVKIDESKGASIEPVVFLCCSESPSFLEPVVRKDGVESPSVGPVEARSFDFERVITGILMEDKVKQTSPQLDTKED